MDGLVEYGVKSVATYISPKPGNLASSGKNTQNKFVQNAKFNQIKNPYSIGCVTNLVFTIKYFL